MSGFEERNRIVFIQTSCVESLNLNYCQSLASSAKAATTKFTEFSAMNKKTDKYKINSIYHSCIHNSHDMSTISSLSDKRNLSSVLPYSERSSSSFLSNNVNQYTCNNPIDDGIHVENDYNVVLRNLHYQSGVLDQCENSMKRQVYAYPRYNPRELLPRDGSRNDCENVSAVSCQPVSERDSLVMGLSPVNTICNVCVPTKTSIPTMQNTTTATSVQNTPSASYIKVLSPLENGERANVVCSDVNCSMADGVSYGSADTLDSLFVRDMHNGTDIMPVDISDLCNNNSFEILPTSISNTSSHFIPFCGVQMPNVSCSHCLANESYGLHNCYVSMAEVPFINSGVDKPLYLNDYLNSPAQLLCSYNNVKVMAHNSSICTYPINTVIPKYIKLFGNMEGANYCTIGKDGRVSRMLREDLRDVLIQWIKDHVDRPYASFNEKRLLCEKTGIPIKKITQFFINYRRRHILRR